MSHFLENIEIKNFKSIRHQKIEGCKKINVFIGYPNVGKSNILEALSLFQLQGNTNGDIRNLYRFENYANLFFNNDISREIEVIVNDDERVLMKYSLKDLNIKVASGNRNMVFNMTFPISEFNVNGFEYVESASEGYDELERIEIRKYQYQNNENNSFSHSNLLNSPYGENISEVIGYNQTLKNEIHELFQDYELKYATDEHNRIRVIKEYGNGDIKIFPYVQIADTLQRLIFYKAAIQTNNNSVLLFEEPEAHMFPPYIRKFTSDVVFDKTNQFFIATHSPYVLDSFIEESMDNLAVFLVDYKNGETIIKSLRKDDLTEIRDYGVDLFFNLESYLKNG